MLSSAHWGLLLDSKWPFMFFRLCESVHASSPILCAIIWGRVAKLLTAVCGRSILRDCVLLHNCTVTSGAQVVSVWRQEATLCDEIMTRWCQFFFWIAFSWTLWPHKCDRKSESWRLWNCCSCERFVLVWSITQNSCKEMSVNCEHLNMRVVSCVSLCFKWRVWKVQMLFLWGQPGLDDMSMSWNLLSAVHLYVVFAVKYRNTTHFFMSCRWEELLVFQFSLYGNLFHPVPLFLIFWHREIGLLCLIAQSREDGGNHGGMYRPLQVKQQHPDCH